MPRQVRRKGKPNNRSSAMPITDIINMLGIITGASLNQKQHKEEQMRQKKVRRAIIIQKRRYKQPRTRRNEKVLRSDNRATSNTSNPMNGIRWGEAKNPGPKYITKQDMVERIAAEATIISK